MSRPVPADPSFTQQRWIIKFYHAIMTPVVFVSFLVALTWVDFRYTLLRSHTHSDASVSSRMPKWLHTLLYRETSYEYVKVRDTQAKTAQSNYAESFYHTKQRKLMKMEADDAFRIRGTVLFALGLLLMIIIWAGWRACLMTWTALRHGYFSI